ncbi:MAG: tail fiber domain-containing protein [Bacteroides sp.]
MAFTGLNLPDIKDSDLNDEKQRRQILEYLYQLTEQLRFVLSNIGEENLTAELSEKIDSTEVIKELEGSIKDAYGNIASLTRTANSLISTVGDLSGNVASIEQYVDSLTLAVTNGETSSVIELKAGNIILASKTIQFNGDIVFSSDLTDGVTKISGDNILTGTISANRIDVNNLSVKRLSGATGTFDSLDAVSGLVHFGSNYIEINGVEIGYVSGYTQVCIIGPGYEMGNIGSGSIPWSQCVAKYLYSSNGSVNSYSMRSLKRDIKPFTLEDGAFDKLEPVYYVMKRDSENRKQIGFIADDVMNVCPELVTKFKDDSMKSAVLTLDYGRITTLLVDEVKKLRTRVKYLEETTA